MAVSSTDLTNPPRRLPHIKLPGKEDTEVPIIWRRTAPILLFLHSNACPICIDFAKRVALLSEAIGEWDGRVLLVVPEATTEVRSGSMVDNIPFPILEDREARLRTAVKATVPAVVIADQWGEIYERIEAGEVHAFPEPQELVDWARVIATKCPECEGEAF